MIYREYNCLITSAVFYLDKQSSEPKMVINFVFGDKIKKLFLNKEQIEELFNIDINKLLDNYKINDIKEIFKGLKGKELTFQESYVINWDNSVLGTVQ